MQKDKKEAKNWSCEKYVGEDYTAGVVIVGRQQVEGRIKDEFWTLILLQV
jgi:hypothetical protein